MNNRLTALLFGPVSPIFEENVYSSMLAFFDRCGFSTKVVDSLDSPRDPAAWGAHFKQIIEANHVSLLFGHAYGGTVAREVGAQLRFDGPCILSSAPLHSGEDLREELMTIAAIARVDGLNAAWQRLSYVVSGTTQETKSPRDGSAERLADGLIRVAEYQCSEAAVEYSRACLNVLGGRSRLVTTRDMGDASLHVLPNSGMRVFDDAPDEFFPLVKNYLILSGCTV